MQELGLRSQIAKLCTCQDLDEVLSALLQNPIGTAALLAAKTRECVEVQYIKSRMYLSANSDERFGPAMDFDIASRAELLTLVSGLNDMTAVRLRTNTLV